MLRPWSLLPALVAVAATVGPPAAAHPPGGPGEDRPPLVSRSLIRTAQPPAPDGDPLEVHLDALVPSYIPARGPLLVSGSVTNTSDEEWLAVNLHPFLADTPITTPEQLVEEKALDPSQPVGDRITTPGAFDNVGDLEPGESARFSIEVPHRLLGMTAPGVYWFGVHALGETTEGRDGTADGRARTFVPLVPDTRRSVNAALVIPVRQDIRYAEDGSLTDVRSWAETLDTGGALRSLVDFGASAGSRPVTWLVDPAVPDAVRSLVAGNPPRSLEDTVPPDAPEDEEEEEEEESASPGPTAEPVPSDSPSPGPDQDEVPTNGATAPGTAWLNRFREALLGDEVLALPYGDLDVSAAVERDPRIYTAARRRSGSELAPWGLQTSPAISAPSGFVDPTAIGSLSRRATILVSDEMFRSKAPIAARAEGRRLTVSSSSAATGGPGPGDPLAAIPLRQQILSEAALHLLNPGRKPLVVVLPPDWAPSETTGFFPGLDVEWLDLTSLDSVTTRPGRRVEPDRLEYPESQVRRELDAANFTSTSGLIGIGETLQNVLTRNDRVADEVRDEALSEVSYASRNHPDASRAEADRSRRWIASQLSSIHVEAPRAVTLSSTTGRFAATITNDLEHPVTVRLEAVADAPMTIEGPDTIEVAAEGRASVLLEAGTDRLGVHNVQLIVTDVDGTALGSSDGLPIRSAQVSDVIWLILGAGGALLFGAIAVRLVRRLIRS